MNYWAALNLNGTAGSTSVPNIGTGGAFSVTASGPILDATTKKFGTASLNTAAGGALQSAGTFSAAGKFSLGFWINPTGNSGTLICVGDQNAGPGGLQMEIYAATFDLWASDAAGGRTNLSTGSSTIGYGVWNFLCIERDASNVVTATMNGAVIGTPSTRAGTISGVLYVGNQYTGGGFVWANNGFYDDVFAIDDDVRFGSYPFAVPTTELTVPSGGTSLTPGAGSLSLTGYAPTVARTANQAITPNVGSVSITGLAPTIARTANQGVIPGVGSLTITGYAPAVTQGAGLTLTPGAGSIAVTGFAPTIAQTLNQSLIAGAGSVVLTGYAPTISQPQGMNPGVGAISITGYAPSVSQPLAVSPGAGLLALAGYAPAVAQTANQAVVPGVGALTVTGFAPSVVQASASPSLVPGAGVLTITGYAPEVVQSSAGGIDTWGSVYVRKKKKPQAGVAGPLPGSTLRETIEKAMAATEPKTSVAKPVFDFEQDEEEALLLLL